MIFRRVKKELIPDCPVCGFMVAWLYACHTWPNGRGMYMSCMPCDSAIEYFCRNDECSWSYTHGLNKNNPRSEKNEESKPSWLVSDSPCAGENASYASAHPGVKAWEDVEDD